MSKTPTDALVVEYDGPIDTSAQLQLRRRPLSSPGSREVMVEVIAAGISHIDGFIRSGRETEWDDPFPRRSGSDFAGIVVQIGSAVTGVTVGSEVIGHVRSGAHATHLVVPANSIVAKPKNVSWEVAGGLFLSGATALDTLDELRIGAGDVVVISAAAGAVGSVEAQIAKHNGAQVIGTCGDRNFDYLRQLGITPVRYGDGIVERIRDAARGPVTCFIDNFGQDGQDLATLLEVPASRYRSSADRRDKELRLLSGDADAVEHGTRQLQRLAEYAANHAFTLLISGYYPLEAIADAYADLQKLHSRGKVVLGTHPVSRYTSLKARDVHEARA